MSDRFYQYWNELPRWRKAWAHVAYLIVMRTPVPIKIRVPWPIASALISASGDLAYRNKID